MKVHSKTLPASTRRCSLSAVLLLATLCLPACSQPANDEAGVRTALESFYGAMKTGDTATAMALIAPDALFLEGGRLETRDEYEKNHLPADIGFEKQVSGTRGPLKITFNGDTAWVIATTDYDGTFDGAPVSFTSAQLALLTRESGTWKIRSIHWSSRRR
jgi:ketosteroid isomerase-like protein